MTTDVSKLPLIRIVLADDHSLVRKGVRKLLEAGSELTVVGEAGNGLEALNLVEELSPEVLIVDMSMPVLDGLEVVRRLVHAGSKTFTLMLTMFDDPHMAARAISMGVGGFLTKDAPQVRLIEAVRTVASGKTYISPELADHTAPEELAILKTLSDREFGVMCYLGRGLTNREIASELNVSIKTIDSHRAKVLKKLKLRNTVELARFTMRHGFTEK